MTRKKFNTAGPSRIDDHYMLDPLARLDEDEVLDLIDDKRYFVLHAPRQTGKTTALLTLMARLNGEGRYQALYANLEGAQAARNDVAAGIEAIGQQIASSAQVYLHDARLQDLWESIHKTTGTHAVLNRFLQAWSQLSAKPIVLILDEVDALIGDTLIALLRQLRAGYAQRPEAFPQSVVLCGVRDVWDYRIHTGNGEIITGGSAFNIKAESLRLGNFSTAECKTLWEQHTEATGQPFDEAIWPELWADTQGQPWLVNALGHECTWKDRSLRNTQTTISLEHYKQARERLIYSRATHLDQLTDKLREPRVHGVIAPLLSGEDIGNIQILTDDQQYVEDLGLIRTRPHITIANRIYQEIIPRDLTWIAQTRIVQEKVWFLNADNTLNMKKLLLAFQQFFRENAEAWLERYDYKEAGPQLLMQAFLQRIINGGGRISREYGLGRKRTDLLLEYPLDATQGFYGPVQRVVIELKILRRALETTISEGIEQTAYYAQTVGANEAHLIIFNRDPAVPWTEKIWQRDEITPAATTVSVWGA